MWLIDTQSLALVFHANVPAKSYVILSHTWEDDEVSFQDFQDIEFARTKRGFTKIETICRFARERQYRYAWVDTCCIDKTSSAELTENINASMYSGVFPLTLSRGSIQYSTLLAPRSLPMSTT
jgi:hypothetical protein